MKDAWKPVVLLVLLTVVAYLPALRERLVKLAQPRGLELRQSYARVGQRTLARPQRNTAAQQPPDHHKLHSVHEPEVECLASTARGNWIVGARAWHGNPDDGHTLGAALAQVQRISGEKPRGAFVDRGCRGPGVAGEPDVQVAPRSRRRWMNRRAAIEPLIGHLKAEHRLERNRLKGNGAISSTPC